MNDLNSSEEKITLKQAVDSIEQEPEIHVVVAPTTIPNQDATSTINGNNLKSTSLSEGQTLKNTDNSSESIGSTDKSTLQTYEILSKTEKKLVYFCLSLGVFLAALDQMIVTVALPVIADELDAQVYFSWVITAYLLTSSATMPLYGKYSDIYGRRLVFEFSLFWFFIGSVLCGAATTIFFLIAARAIQGIGGGGLMALGMILIGDIAKPAVRAKYMSSMSAIFGLATVFGPLLGGVFTDYVSWRFIFYINSPFTLFTMVACWKILGKIKNAQKQLPIDIIGSVLIFSATVCLVLVVTWGGDKYDWSNPIIICLIIVAVIFLIGFTYEELKHPEPILNLRLFNIQNFVICCLVMFFFGMAMLGAFAFIPYFFQNVHGDKSIISGLKIVPMVVGVMSSSFIVGIYISKTGKFILFPTLGMAIFTVGSGLLILMDVHSSYSIEWVYLFVVGLGIGVCFPVFNSIVQNSVPPKDMASSIAGVTFVRSIGGAIGVAIFGNILTQQYNKTYDNTNSEYAFSIALQYVFLSATCSAIIALILAFGIKNVSIFARKSVANSSKNDTEVQQEEIKMIAETNML